MVVKFVIRFKPGLIIERPFNGACRVNGVASLLAIAINLLLTKIFPTICGVDPESTTVLLSIAVSATLGKKAGPMLVQVLPL